MTRSVAQARDALIERVGFASAYSFKYSPRPGTPASAMSEQVPEAVKNERLAALQERIATHATAFNASCVGRAMNVLLEKPGRHPGQLTGRSPYLQPVQVMADPALIGSTVPVQILQQQANSLMGELIESEKRVRPTSADLVAAEA